ncbi:MAG: hypothetical protein H0W74_14475, partial [Sphingosinicella sp.]|nr:hypothetical protein [Sphingosinicella sp.]
MAVDKITPKILKEFADKNSGLLGQDGMMMGGWYDGDSKKFYLDVSQRVPRADAPALLQARGEKAGWDLDAGAELANPNAKGAVSAGIIPGPAKKRRGPQPKPLDISKATYPSDEIKDRFSHFLGNHTVLGTWKEEGGDLSLSRVTTDDGDVFFTHDPELLSYDYLHPQDAAEFHASILKQRTEDIPGQRGRGQVLGSRGDDMQAELGYDHRANPAARIGGEHEALDLHDPMRTRAVMEELRTRGITPADLERRVTQDFGQVENPTPEELAAFTENTGRRLLASLDNASQAPIPGPRPQAGIKVHTPEGVKEYRGPIHPMAWDDARDELGDIEGLKIEEGFFEGDQWLTREQAYKKAKTEGLLGGSLKTQDRMKKSKRLYSEGLLSGGIPEGEEIIDELPENMDELVAEITRKHAAGGGAVDAPARLGAPQLNLGSEAPALDESRLKLVPDYVKDPTERAPAYRAPRADLSYLEPMWDRIRNVFGKNADRILRDDPKGAAWYDVSPLRQAFIDETPTGLEDFERLMKFQGPTSTGTRTPDNVKQAGYMYYLSKSQDPARLLDDLRDGTLLLPEGYANRRQSSVNSGILDILEKGNLDPFEQAKTFRYGNIPTGRHFNSSPNDMHVGRQSGRQGLLKQPGHTASNPKLKPGRGYPEPSYPRTKLISSSPSKASYAPIEDRILHEAEKRSLPGAPFMAAGWVGGAEQT